MLLGLALKISNCIFFKTYIDLFFEALPQTLFLMSTFGYMCLCIIIKWFTPYVPGKDIPILSIFINFPTVKEPLFGSPGIQQNFQTALLAIAAISALVMYLPKPILKYRNQKKEIRYRPSMSENLSYDLSEHSMISVL